MISCISCMQITHCTKNTKFNILTPLAISIMAHLKNGLFEALVLWPWICGTTTAYRSPPSRVFGSLLFSTFLTTKYTVVFKVELWMSSRQPSSFRWWLFSRTSLLLLLQESCNFVLWCVWWCMWSMPLNRTVLIVSDRQFSVCWQCIATLCACVGDRLESVSSCIGQNLVFGLAAPAHQFEVAFSHFCLKRAERVT